MRSLFLVSVLLCCSTPLLAQPANSKTLWSQPTNGYRQLLTATPDSKELYTLEYKVQKDEILGLTLFRNDIATGKEPVSYPLEEIETPELSTSKLHWKEATFDAAPDGQTLLVTVPKPFSSTRQNVYGLSFLQLYDLKTGKRRGDLIQKVITHSTGRFSEKSTTCFSPDGKYFSAFTKGYGDQLNIYSCETGKIVFTYDSTWPEKAPQCVAFSADSKRIALFCQTGKGYCVVVHSWPEGRVQKEFHLPTDRHWQMIHSWQGNLACVEAMEEDEKSKEAGAAAGLNPRPIQASSRLCYSFDMSADDPLSTLKKQPMLTGFHGENMGMPSILWDVGPTWVSSFTQHSPATNVQQAGGAQKPVTYYYWRDTKVMDSQTGKVIFQLKGIPDQCQLTRDGLYLIAVGSGPDVEDGIHVWKLPTK